MNKRIIHTVFDQQAVTAPERVAVEEGRRSWTYKELKESSEALTQYLLHYNPATGTPVAVMLPPGFSLVSALLAVFRSGNIYMPLDASLPAKKLHTIFEQTRPAVCVTTLALASVAENIIREQSAFNCTMIVLDEELPVTVKHFEDSTYAGAETPGSIAFQPFPEIRPDDANYIIYTSGSTGEAKAIVGCHDSLSHFIHWEMNEFKLDNGVRVSQLSQFTFDASLRDVFVPLSIGGTLCFPPAGSRTNIPLLIEWLEESQINLVHCVPSIFKLITRSLNTNTGKQLLPALKHILMAGERLYSKDVSQWRCIAGEHVELVNLYGTSETTMAKTFHRIKAVPEDPSAVIHVGRPLNNTMIAVVNGSRLCRAGEIGEIYIVTPFMTKGYYKNEALTRTVFVQNPLVTDREEIVHRTGDYGVYLEDGSVEVIGRKDEQVKVNGVRVELGEVKQAVLRLDGISGAEIIALKNTADENELICYYTSTEVKEDVLRTHLESELARYMLPAALIRMEEFPLTINGKVDKNALPKPEKVLISDDAYVAPQTPTENKLEAMWQELLGLTRVGTAINFFRVGGASLKVIKMVSQIFHVFNVSLTFADVFVNNTIRQLATLIDETVKTGGANIVPLPEKEYYDVTYAQRRLWIYDKLGGQKNLYNIVHAVELKGNIKPALIREALVALITRHEMLRTTFIEVDGEPKQRVHPVNSELIPFAYFDRQQQLELYGGIPSIVWAEQQREFNLETGPLFFNTLLQLDNDHYAMVFNWHHIIGDGWTQDVLLNDLLVLYNTLEGRGEQTLKPLRFQYRDYADWMNRQLQGERLKEMEEYWATRFAAPFTPATFPAQTDRNKARAGIGHSIDFLLDQETTRQLRALTQVSAVTDYISLHAIVNILLYHYSGTADIVTGAPFSGRPRLELQDQAGFYVNLMPLRVTLDPEDNFLTVLDKTRECITGAHKYQEYPIDMLVQRLGLDARFGRMPMFNILIQSQNNLEYPISDIEGMSVKQIELTVATSKVDVTFNFQENGDEILASIEYDTELYTEKGIRLVIENFLTVIRTLSRLPATKIKDITIERAVDEEEEEQSFMNALSQL
ncbi:condensation domain-containing protein [Chitinophaga pinensis]|uniref:AMP-dependent synthetase and ligase n=1 Tax=Chitinophaga pinensis (strain ATCC 43595 / DSM 2588 / LMG 13176 / NBRC 15968 / NCIMB 11800 / UQM 2034) TaxID=485918 RepID=A0A979G562_CHIPD|nr:condensation domain-containing protein [Chitinophaga pinensis]ACU60868.1 AMP-dependent synthetase and ligase [Chitinophaga pinensis DSM 2588]